MAGEPMRLGLCLPAFASPGAGLFRTPGFDRLDPAAVVELAREAEDLGFDSVWSPDHLMIGRDEAVLEGWTLLSYVAAVTKRVRLGLIQQACLFRDPALTAKMAATLDVLSGGRFTLFYNFGMKEAEHRAYGLPWIPDEAERIAHCAEALAIMRRLWSEDGQVTHEGRFHRLDAAVCNPRPVQRPHPPIWIGSPLPGNLALAAEVADGWNSTPVTPDEYAARSRALDTACTMIGRPPGAIERSFETQILVARDVDGLRRSLQAMIARDPGGGIAGRPPALGADADDFLAGRSDDVPAALTERWLVGTPEQVCQQIAAYRRASVEHLILWFMDLPERDGLRLFTAELMPMLRSAATG